MPKKNLLLTNKSNINYVEVGERLKKIRKSLGKTLSSFSTELGVSASYISDCEHGTKPSIEFIMSVASQYNISIDYILKGKENLITKIEDDPDLKDMVQTLVSLRSSPDPEIRSWTKIQFDRAFLQPSIPISVY